MTSLSYRDVGRWEMLRRVAVTLAALVPAYWATEGTVCADTIFMPALSVTGTYDSNVFYTPKSAIPAGQKPEDFFATITPQLLVAHKGASINGSLAVGALVTRYKNNPALDYTGYNASTNIDVKEWVYKLVPRIENLNVLGSYQFTPSLSAFSATGGGSFGGGFGGIVSGPLNAGIVTNRVTTTNYTGTISGGYRLTPVTSVTGSYSYNQLTFGSQSGGVNNLLFNTIGHTGTVGIKTRLSQTDTVGTLATLSHFDQGGASSGAAGITTTFTNIIGMATWTKQWTRELSSTLGAGGIATLPIDTGVPGQTIKATLTPTVTSTVSYTSYSEQLRAAGAALTAQGFQAPIPFQGLPSLAGTLNPGGILPQGRYNASLGHSFSVYPSYAIGVGPTKVHIVGANLSGGLLSNLTGLVGLNYAHGTSSNPGTQPIRYDTAGITTGVNYLIAPSLLAALTYEWLYFSTTIPQSATVQDESAFSKKMVMLSFAYVFNGQAFFRAGGFGNLWSPNVGGSPTSPAPDASSKDK